MGNAGIMVTAFKGILSSEQKRAAKKQRQDHLNLKNVTNMIYYATAIRIFHSSSDPPIPDAFGFIDKLDCMDSKQQEQIRELYRQRKVDKSRTGIDLEPFARLIEESYDIVADCFCNKTTYEEKQSLEEEANEKFLEIVNKNV